MGMQISRVLIGARAYDWDSAPQAWLITLGSILLANAPTMLRNCA